MNFNIFKTAVAKQFERMSQHQLFRTSVDKDALWATYLASFPEGSNPIYKVRTEHDCTCCKQFIRAVGNVVAVINGHVESIWDIDVADAEPAYQVVACAMRALATAAPITDAFLHDSRTAGTDKNFQDTLDGVKRWDHFFVNIPARFVMAGKDIPTKLNEHRTAHDVFKRGLEEITDDALDTVLELIAQNSLYRGEEQRFVVEQFKAAKARLGSPDAHTWPLSMTLPPAISRIRNTAIGTLLVALSEGTPLEDAVKAFEAMVAPANYKRPTALVTKAMVERAKTTIESLGLTSALTRRYATINDLTINNVLFADRSARKAMGADVFDTLATAAVNPKTYGKVEQVTIERFLADILPKATELEILVENRHTGNLVSLIAPQDPTAAELFKWNNRFSWSYIGDVADSIKERVKKAGGSVEGDLCCRLAWDYEDDLDFRMSEPGDSLIYYGNYRRAPSPNGGMLDVDANGVDGLRDDPVENIFYANSRRMRDGIYELSVNNYSRREPDKKGFEVEIEFGGATHSIVYDKALRNNESVVVAKLRVNAGEITLVESLPSSVATKAVWGLTTQTFQPVRAVMLSPNHWDNQDVGNKHWFFMLKDCLNEGQARGFYNEFLKAELNEHRKTLEMVGAKLKTETASEQLSGLGFSSTQRNSVLCRVSGSFSRVINITF